MHQLEDTVKVRDRLKVFRVCLQVKRGRVTLDAQVFGASCSLHTEGEKVPGVRAVPDEESPNSLSCQHGVGLFSVDGAPVEAALLQLVQRVQDHLVLRLGGESLVTLRQPHVGGFQKAAAHREVKLAVSYHGAVPTLEEAWGEHGAPHRQEEMR